MSAIYNLLEKFYYTDKQDKLNIAFGILLVSVFLAIYVNSNYNPKDSDNKKYLLFIILGLGLTFFSLCLLNYLKK